MDVGWRFIPTHLELINDYLLKKIMNAALPSEAVVEHNVYESEPWFFQGDEVAYYFVCREKKFKNNQLSKRPVRNVKSKDGTSFGGFWKATAGDKRIYSKKGKLVGLMKTLVFCLYKNEKMTTKENRKTDWIMHEYNIHVDVKSSASSSSSLMKFQPWVLCSIRNNGKPHQHQNQHNAAAYGTAAGSSNIAINNGHQATAPPQSMQELDQDMMMNTIYNNVVHQQQQQPVDPIMIEDNYNLIYLPSEEQIVPHDHQQQMYMQQTEIPDFAHLQDYVMEDQLPASAATEEEEEPVVLPVNQQHQVQQQQQIDNDLDVANYQPAAHSYLADSSDPVFTIEELENRLMGPLDEENPPLSSLEQMNDNNFNVADDYNQPAADSYLAYSSEPQFTLEELEKWFGTLDDETPPLSSLEQMNNNVGVADYQPAQSYSDGSSEPGYIVKESEKILLEKTPPLSNLPLLSTSQQTSFSSLQETDYGDLQQYSLDLFAPDWNIFSSSL